VTSVAWPLTPDSTAQHGMAQHGTHTPRWGNRHAAQVEVTSDSQQHLERPSAAGIAHSCLQVPRQLPCCSHRGATPRSSFSASVGPAPVPPAAAVLRVALLLVPPVLTSHPAGETSAPAWDQPSAAAAAAAAALCLMGNQGVTLLVLASPCPAGTCWRPSRLPGWQPAVPAGLTAPPGTAAGTTPCRIQHMQVE